MLQVGKKLSHLTSMKSSGIALVSNDSCARNIMNWCKPLMTTNCEETNEFKNDSDIATIAKPFARAIKKVVRDTLGSIAKDKSNRTTQEEKKVFALIMSTVGLMKFLQKRVPTNVKIQGQVGGAMGLARGEWVLSPLALQFNHFGSTSQKHVRSPVASS